MIGSIERLNFTGLCLQDGPVGIRQAVYANVYPAGVNVASTWDRNAFYKRSHYMGLEFKAKGSQIALAPVVGPLGRDPYGGRNWEGISPEPYLRYFTLTALDFVRNANLILAELVLRRVLSVCKMPVSRPLRSTSLAMSKRPSATRARLMMAQ